MDTKNLKAYAPQARRDFIAAVTKRAAQFGLYEDRITDVVIEGSSAIIEGRVFTRKQAMQRGQLATRINELGFNQFINEAAFTWVNRLTAIRYMEVNGYLEHGFRILSMPPKKDANENEVTAKFGDGFEIFAHAADVAEHLELDKSNIVKMLLAGDKEEELYREILLGECHQLSKVMPFMFEKLDDATELLLPDNLTKTDSILKELVDKIPETDWQDIEVIGWLYQFYISEHKDAVIGKVVKKEDIPAATQLFTPNWIVKYLVQNSLGRQWLATYPESELKDKMEYYITPAEQSVDVIEQLKAITPSSIDPETIKVLDPACGSGHILVEVYEVLREIYLERGYRLREIPELILTKNIYGLDIDDRAAQMAAFAVLMKAREDDHRIFDRIASNDIKLNIHSLQSTENLDIYQLWSDLDLEGKQQFGDMADMFSAPQLEPSASLSTENQSYLDLLRYLKSQFIDAKNLGSLIDVDNLYLAALVGLKGKLLEKVQSSHHPIRQAVEVLLPIVEQALVLTHNFDVIVANPPYMGNRAGMNDNIKVFADKHYKESKGDTFTLFISRCLDLIKKGGHVSMVTLDSWLTLSTYESFRESILTKGHIDSFMHMPYEGKKPTAMGINFGVTSFTLMKTDINGIYGSFIKQRYTDLRIDGSPKVPPSKDTSKHVIISDTFLNIPSNAIVYSLSDEGLNTLSTAALLGEKSEAREGMATADNERFLRWWFEVQSDNIFLNCDSLSSAQESERKWFPYIKGGEFKRWSGNLGLVVNWENDGYSIKHNINPSTKKVRSHNYNGEFAFRSGMTWTSMSSKGPSARYVESGFMFDAKGPMLFSNQNTEISGIALMNSAVGKFFLSALSATKDFKIGQILSLPIADGVINSSVITNNTLELIELTNLLETQSETSWSFKGHLLIDASSQSKIKQDFLDVEQKHDQTLYQAATKESEINRYLIDVYGLKDEVSPDVTISDLTLSSLEAGTCSSTLLSYFVGCAMGRYSLDREGIIYALSANKGFKELVSDGAYNTFPADDDGIIPLASEAWFFDDDATARFREFVKAVWGKEHLQENMDFVAESLCLNAINYRNGESSLDTIRRYLSTQFYKDHIQTYKKRPIYWLFSSGKSKAFECLVYLHRYNEGTLSRMRTEYVTPLMGKFESQTSILRDERNTASSSEQRRIDRELKLIETKQAELRTFDEELKHYSEMKISLDLDEGVKQNYGKFGNLLANVKDIHGKNSEVIK